MNLIEELDPKLQIVINESINLVQYLKVNFLKQNDKDFLLKQQLLLNRIKSSPNYVKKSLDALYQILENIETLQIAPKGLSAIFSILDTCLLGFSDEKLKQLICNLFVKTIKKIQELTTDEIFLLRDLEQPINPFVLLSYNDISINEKEGEEGLHSEMGMCKNSLEFEGVVRRSKYKHLFLINLKSLKKINQILLQFNKFASNPINIPFTVEINEVAYDEDGVLSEKLIKRRVFDDSTSMFLSEFVQKQTSNFKKFINDDKLNRLGFRFSNLITKYLKIIVMFNDVPCYSLCQLSKDTTIDVICIGEASDSPISQNLTDNNSEVWSELQDIQTKIANKSFTNFEEESNVVIFQCKSSDDNNTSENTTKNEEVKKTLEDLKTKVSGWQVSLKEHLELL